MTNNLTIAAAAAKVAALEDYYAAGGNADSIGYTATEYQQAKTLLEIANLRNGGA